MVVKKAKLLVDFVNAKKMAFNNAVTFCINETKKTKMECLFTYDAKTKKITSAIIEGVEKDVILMPYDVFGEKQGIKEPNAVFHTHPKTPGSCSFSSVDINTDLVKESRKEISLGCTNKNVLLTFDTMKHGNVSFKDHINGLMNKHSTVVGDNKRLRERFKNQIKELKKNHPELEAQLDDLIKEYDAENTKEFKKKFGELYSQNASFRSSVISFINNKATKTKLA